MQGAAEERTRIEEEIQEIEGLVKRYRDSDDPETCWAIYLLALALRAKRKRLRAGMKG